MMIETHASTNPQPNPNIDQSDVDEVFHRVAERYDLMNDILSFGFHRLWKDALVAALAPPKRGAFAVLDVASGSGDLATRIARSSNGAAAITATDINPAMLSVGRRRLLSGDHASCFRFALADGAQLPFPDCVFDAYVIGFGIRNIQRLDAALREAHRVLRRGGRFLCLEFSDCDMPFLDAAYAAYGRRVIPALGEMVVGDASPYIYLVESIRKFPDKQRFSRLICDAGFSRVSVRAYSGGIACLHMGWKF